MVYLPLGLDAARTLRSGGQPVAGRAFAATPSLCAALELTADDEEADFAALSAAGVAALADPAVRRRLVLAAEVDPTRVQDHGDDVGTVDVAGLGWAQVRSLFADEEAAADAVAAGAAAICGVALTEAFDVWAVVALSDGFDLLWFDPSELDSLG